MQLIKRQRDKRLVLMALLMFEDKRYDELERKYGYSSRSISLMKRAINEGTPMELVDNTVEKKSEDENDIRVHGNSVAQDIIDQIIQFVEQKCETYPLRRRGKTHFVRGINASIISLYNDYSEHSMQLDQQISLPTFYRLFNTRMKHVEIPKSATEFCSSCAFYKAINLDDIEPTSMKTYRTLYNEHMTAANNAWEIYKSMTFYRKGGEHVIAFDFKNAINLPKTRIHMSASNFADKLKVEVFAVVSLNRSIKIQLLYLFNNYSRSTKKDLIAHSLGHYSIMISKNKPKRLTVFADNAASQNKNKFILYLMESVRQSIFLECIRYNFLEVGHTHNDVDLFFGQLTRVLLEIDIFCPNDIVNAVHNSGIAECHYYIHQVKNFSELFIMAEKIQDISTIQTFVLENNTLYGSEIMLGPKREGEKLKKLLKFNNFSEKLKIQQIMNSPNVLEYKELDQKEIKAFADTTIMFPSMPKKSLEFFSQTFTEITKNPQLVQKQFAERIEDNRTKFIKTIDYKEAKKKNHQSKCQKNNYHQQRKHQQSNHQQRNHQKKEFSKKNRMKTLFTLMEKYMKNNLIWCLFNNWFYPSKE